MCLLYHLLPLEIACYGNDDIQSVETSLEGYAFYDIQVAAYYIDDDPEEPLLDVLACQSPQTHKAQGVGETVEKWNRRIGIGRQYIIGESPCHKEEDGGRKIERLAHTGNRQFFFSLLVVLLSKLPYGISVDCSHGIVSSHTGIAIQAMTPIEPDVEGWHHNAYQPEINAGTVLQQDVNQSEYRGDDV